MALFANVAGSLTFPHRTKSSCHFQNAHDLVNWEFWRLTSFRQRRIWNHIVSCAESSESLHSEEMEVTCAVPLDEPACEIVEGLQHFSVTFNACRKFVYLAARPWCAHDTLRSLDVGHAIPRILGHDRTVSGRETTGKSGSAWLRSYEFVEEVMIR
jgi:hypothetical protein